VDDLATLGGRETGIALHDGHDTPGELREASAPLLRTCSTGRNREKRGREYDRWGPRVRFQFSFDL